MRRWLGDREFSPAKKENTSPTHLIDTVLILFASPLPSHTPTRLPLPRCGIPSCHLRAPNPASVGVATLGNGRRFFDETQRPALLGFFDCGRVLFGSRVAKREAEGTVHTKHQLNLDPNPEGT